MNVVSGGVHGPAGTLSPLLSLFSISFCPILFPILLRISFIFLCVLSSHHSVTLFFLFSPISSHSLTHKLYCKLLYLSLSLPSFPPSPLALISFLYVILSFFSQWISCWLGHGLQHRTWVLPLLPARVLCCSQWSCLSASLPVCLPTAAELRSPEQLDPTNHGAADSAAGFASSIVIKWHNKVLQSKTVPLSYLSELFKGYLLWTLLTDSSQDSALALRHVSSCNKGTAVWFHLKANQTHVKIIIVFKIRAQGKLNPFLMSPALR